MTDYLSFKADLANSEVAETFDDLSYWSSMFGQLLFRHLRLAPRLTALDIGCGTGFPLLELADRLGPTCTIHGIDSWAHAVARAKVKARVRGSTNVHVAHGDAAGMPYDDSSFDLIVSNLGVNNFDAPTLVMAECRRVCKPTGRIALTTNLVGHMSEFYLSYEQALVDTGNSHLIDRLHHHQAHRATPEGLHDLFSSGGFEVTACHTETLTLRYADGSALLRAYLSRLGFLDGWRSVLRGTGQETAVFEELESRLNRISREGDGGLCLSIPAAYIEGQMRE
ncbi:MAG: methyltransferase domain-containing protein [Phycisphaerales bacterium]|nr:methyltransferase domain-containing protein [Phycisphaerales bacterium]